MKENVLILRNSDKDYFFGDILDLFDIKSTFDSAFDYKYFVLLNKMHMDIPMLFNDWKKDIKKYDKVIIFDFGWDERITAFIRRYNSRCKIHLFFFNTITLPRHFLMLQDKNIDKFWTFDPNDADKYGLCFNTPMYSKEYIKRQFHDHTISSDVIFVGKAKEREGLIRAIEKQCKDAGLSTDFTVVKTPDDYIGYNDYMNRVMHSKCILDITNEGQAGLTLRFMEALFASKKILTNNPDVKKYDFYHSDNICVIDNQTDIGNFIKKPVHRVSDEIVSYYDMPNWIKRFQ